MPDRMNGRMTNGQRDRRRMKRERESQEARRAAHKTEGRPDTRLIAAKAFELILEADASQDKSVQDAFFERLVLRVMKHKLPGGGCFNEAATREAIDGLRLRSRDEHDERMLLREAQGSDMEASEHCDQTSE